MTTENRATREQNQGKDFGGSPFDQDKMLMCAVQTGELKFIPQRQRRTLRVMSCGTTRSEELTTTGEEVLVSCDLIERRGHKNMTLVAVSGRFKEAGFARRAPARKCGLEAPSGFEPLHRSFADCSLSHLGTAPRGKGHYIR